MSATSKSITSTLFERGSSPSTYPPLCPIKPWDAALTSQIDSLDLPPASRTILHLLNDDISRAHSIAQADDSNMSSNYVHAILHRRERDYWNSQWWFRQIDHPVLTSHYTRITAPSAQSSTSPQTAACAFVDACEDLTGPAPGKTRNGKNKGGASCVCGAGKLDELREMQWWEMRELAEWVLANEHS